MVVWMAVWKAVMTAALRAELMVLSKAAATVWQTVDEMGAQKAVLLVDMKAGSWDQ
jgi:hypothetical protein